MNNRTARIGLFFLAGFCLAVPTVTFLMKGGIFRITLGYGRNPAMLAEILVWAALLALILHRIKRLGTAYLSMAFFAAAVLWLHVVILPAIVTFLYLAGIMLTGRMIRVLSGFGNSGDNTDRDAGTNSAAEVFGAGLYAIVPAAADFLLGASGIVVLFCAMSLVRLGTVHKMQAASLAVFALAALFSRRGIRSAIRYAVRLFRDERPAAGRRGYLAGCAFVLMILLIQAARMNCGADYDSLWYGLRSAWILAIGGGIYDDPGMIGMVYVYSKGFEVLTLPLSGLCSYAYIFFFNLWLLVFGLTLTYHLAWHFMTGRGAFSAVVLSAAVPAITNMAITAKADIITWLVQLIMLDLFFEALSRGKKPEAGLAKRETFLYLMTIGAYLFSLTLKPTALVFSSALFGMMGLSLIAAGRLPVIRLLRRLYLLLLPLLSLIGIWGRTYKLTGMPVMSVFTSIFAKLGFALHYPFSVSSLPANYEEEGNALLAYVVRLFRIFLAPSGKEMNHVRVAWGTSLIFFALVVILAAVLMHFLRGRKCAGRESAGENASPKEAGKLMYRTAAAILIPFGIVCAVSLVMLYQVDGNYFILLDSLILIVLAGIADRFGSALRRGFKKALVPILVWNLVITSLTSWAWTSGFYRIRPINKGRVNDRAITHELFDEYGNASIYQILAADKNNRVLAFGIHPQCLQFPCIVQAYKELYYPWGDDAITASAETLERYLRYAKTNYVYASAWYMGETQYPWGYKLVTDMIADGTLGDMILENGNALFRVMPKYGKAAPDEAAANLAKFEEVYCRTEKSEWNEAELSAKMQRDELAKR